jgi:hypothetical protein
MLHQGKGILWRWIYKVNEEIWNLINDRLSNQLVTILVSLGLYGDARRNA